MFNTWGFAEIGKQVWSFIQMGGTTFFECQSSFTVSNPVSFQVLIFWSSRFWKWIETAE